MVELEFSLWSACPVFCFLFFVFYFLFFIFYFLFFVFWDFVADSKYCLSPASLNMAESGFYLWSDCPVFYHYVLTCRTKVSKKRKENDNGRPKKYFYNRPNISELTSNLK